jgi:hypothetical protein
MGKPALATLAVLAVLTACAGPPPPPAPTSGAAPSGPAASSPAGSGGAPIAPGSGPPGTGAGVPAVPAVPGGRPAQPPPGDPAPPPNLAVPAPPRRDCAASTDEATARPGEAPGTVCLRVGATLLVTAAPSPDQPWGPLTTSDPAVLGCSWAPGPDGTIEAGCRALRPGVATLSTAPAGGDAWRLSVTVVA